MLGLVDGWRPRTAVLILWAAAILAGCAPAGIDPGVPGAADAAVGATAATRAEQLLRMGATALERGEATTAAALLERAVQLAPEDTRAAVLLGRAFLALDRPRDAADVFRLVLDHEPDNLHASRGFARAMLALDRPEVAIAHLEPLVARSDDVDLANLLGVALAMAGQGGRAAALLRDAMQRAPDDARLVNNLALVLALDGQFEEAIELLRPLAEGPQTSRRARQNLALIYGLAGRFEAAERLSRVDLDDEAVTGNMTFLRLLAQGSPAASMAELVPPYGPRADDVVEIRTPKPAGEAKEGVPEQGAFSPRDVSAGQTPPTDSAPKAERPGSRDTPPVPIAAVALEARDLLRGASPVGEWVLRLGMYSDGNEAAAAWRRLQQQFPEQLDGLTRLSAAEPGPQPLLVGTLASEAEARRVCMVLREGGADCHPLRL